MDNHDLTQIKKVYLIDDESEKHWYVAVSQEQAEGLYLSDFGLDREDLQWSRTTEVPGEDPLDIGYEWEPNHVELSNAIEHGPRDYNWWRYRGIVNVAGVDYQIVDIQMRMLSPRELFRAQGFPDTYVIDPEYNGKPLTKTAQVKACGNSVCPQLAEALVKANVQLRQVEDVCEPLVGGLFK